MFNIISVRPVDPPVYCKPRRLNSQKLKIAKNEFQFLLNHGILRPSKSQWASPLLLTIKKNGQWRACGDYRALNARTIPDRYPVPRAEDVSEILEHKNIFSKIDLHAAFYQIPLAEEDKPKTAIITPFGLYEFNVMPFGLRNAPSTFQRFIHNVLSELPYCFVYIDDILIASRTAEEHTEHLKVVFERLNSYGLRINISNQYHGVEEVTFLGFLISGDGIRPDSDRVKLIANDNFGASLIFIDVSFHMQQNNKAYYMNTRNMPRKMTSVK